MEYVAFTNNFYVTIICFKYDRLWEDGGNQTPFRILSYFTLVSCFVVCYDITMSVTAKFQNTEYTVHITDHAQARMIEREIAVSLLITIIETGEIKSKPKQDNAFWVFTEVLGRSDNLVCVSLVIETTSLVIKTVLINWRPT